MRTQKRYIQLMLVPDISELRKAANGQELPNPRVISNLIDKAEDFNSQSNTITLASVHLMFSQMIAHDTTRRSGSEIKGCDTKCKFFFLHVCKYM